jgi:Bacterial SH3 domain
MVKSSPTGNRASARLVRFAETEATRAMQFKQTRDFSNVKPEASERIRLVETALRAAAQRSAPQASSGGGGHDRQLSTRTLSASAQRFRKSRIVALISLALVLPSLVGVAVWPSVLHSPLANVSQQSQFIPPPVLTVPAFLEATAGESVLLPIALDGTDGVPADSTLAVTGLPQGSTLSKGRPLGDTGWKLERDEIGDPQLVLPSSAPGQAKITIQLVAPDATVVADAETVLQVATTSQVSLPRNAEDTNDAPLTPAKEAKPSAAGTEREEEPVQPERRIVQSQRRAPAKRTIAIVGTNEVKTSVFLNLRQAPSPSAEVIRVVAKGTKLRVVARKGSWVQVTDPATSAKGWIYTGDANPPRTMKPSPPAEPSENTQPKSDSVWPSFLRGGMASG